MFRDLRFAHKMVFLPLLATSGFLLILFVSWLLGRENERLLTEIEKGYVPALELSRDLEETMRTIHKEMENAVVSFDLEALGGTDVLRDRFLARLKEGSNNPVIEAAVLNHLETEFLGYYNQVRETCTKMIAGETGSSFVEVVDHMQSAYGVVTELLQSNTTRVEEAMASGFVSTQQNRRISMENFAAITLLCVLMLGGSSALFSHRIAQRLDVAVVVTNRIAEGDLSSNFETGGADEVGQPLRAVENMVGKLLNIIGAVRSTAFAVNSAAAQVSSASRVLADGTNAQTANSEATRSNLEEMGASIAQNADNSCQMEKMVVQGARKSEQSGQAVIETVESMHSIAGKISIITEIAHQTNLLALNAAIEAASAGSHGKGFAVVATEVRRLAERSQEAAKGIDSLVSSSVGVAETAGHSLSELVQSIRKTAKLVQGVAKASQEQSMAVSLVNDAMERMDLVTQRTASSAQDLSSASAQLTSQAEALTDLMAFFRLRGH